ncbi:MAG: hypothetical protein IKK96_01835, partial [Lachnospiraceae bacterium]|nr:hypothetical protein [Lachnospiraceae bacterium]
WDESYRLKEQYEAEIRAFQGELEATRAENKRLDEVVAALTGQVAHLDNYINAIRSTFVWRTADKIRGFIKKFKKR